MVFRKWSPSGLQWWRFLPTNNVEFVCPKRGRVSQNMVAECCGRNVQVNHHEVPLGPWSMTSGPWKWSHFEFHTFSPMIARVVVIQNNMSRTWASGKPMAVWSCRPTRHALQRFQWPFEYYTHENFKNHEPQNQWNAQHLQNERLREQWKAQKLLN